MYCGKCGRQLEQGSRFCISCGNPVYQPAVNETAYAAAPAYTEMYAVPGENSVLVMSTHRKISIFKRTACYIVFMNDKAVFAHLSAERQKAESAKAAQWIKDNGLGFFKGSAAMMRYWSSYQQKYYGMSSAQILTEDPSNFVLSYQNIKKVIFKCESTSYDSDGSSGSSGSLRFTLFDGGKLKFSHSLSHDKGRKNTLLMLFADKLKYGK